jgi:hypothetical protein
MFIGCFKFLLLAHDVGLVFSINSVLRWVHKIAKNYFSFSYLSDRPYFSVRMEKFGSLWKDFRENGCLSIFRNSVQEIQVLLKSDENKGHFT